MPCSLLPAKIVRILLEALSLSRGDVREPVFASIVLKFTEDDYTWFNFMSDDACFDG